MKRRIGEYCNGTSAIDYKVQVVGSCRIIRPEFQRSRPARNRSELPCDKPRLARRIFEGSEMLCSIAYEDYRGCAYGIFSRGEVIATSIIVSVLAAIAIALGA